MIVVATNEAEVDAILGRLAEAGATDARVIAPNERRRLVLVPTADDWAAERLVARLREDGLIAVARPDDGARLAGWQEHTRPGTFGNRLSICVAWSEHERNDLPGLIELGLGGFGNGHHPTTRLLIEALLDRVAGGERVLDVGCGSGVLGLSALRLGAARLVAMDLKAEAVAATARNAALNAMEDQVQATLSPLADLDGTFDVILANVARAAIVELGSDLVRRLAPGGWLAVSGITPSQCAQVAAFLHPLVEIERRDAGDWSAVLFAHPTDPPMNLVGPAGRNTRRPKEPR